MRNTAILAAAAFLATACDTPDSRQGDQAATTGDSMMADGSTTDPQSMAPGSDGAMTGEKMSAGTYVARAANSDMYEIEAGKLAVKNGQSEQTRQFGQMMIDDHTQSSQDMKATIAKAGVSMAAPARLDAEHQAMIERLKSAKGAAFDREYQTQQMAAHAKALALHEGYAADSDNAELKMFAQKVTPVIRKHHDQVRAMAGTATMATPTAGTGTMDQGAPGMNSGTQ